MDYHQRAAFGFNHGLIQRGQETKKIFQAGFAQLSSVLVSPTVLASCATHSPERPGSPLSWPVQDDTTIP